MKGFLVVIVLKNKVIAQMPIETEQLMQVLKLTKGLIKIWVPRVGICRNIYLTFTISLIVLCIFIGQGNWHGKPGKYIEDSLCPANFS